MENPDLYRVLGVARDATPEQIKKAYYKLATKHHPDKGGDKAVFQEIGNAYAILSDPDMRARYDRGEDVGKPDNTIAKLMDGLTRLLVKMLQTHDCKFIDIVEMMRNEIDAQIAQGEKLLAQVEEAKSKIAEARSRFSGETEPFEAILNNTVAGMDRQKADIEGDVKTLKEMYEKVKKVKYRVDKRAKGDISGYTKVTYDDLFKVLR